MTDSIIILGSTGSIGTQALEVCSHLGISVTALAAGHQIDRLAQQIRRWHPTLVSVADAQGAGRLVERLADYPRTLRIVHGREGLLEVATCSGADLVLAAMVGVAGLEPVLHAIRAGKNIALANKETLVAGGSLVMPLLQKYGRNLYPVDSEHSAIWQCLAGSSAANLRRIFLTASGGPFRGRSIRELSVVTREEALRHPTWRMGGKITVDSATLMNKGLEVIEASWLFDCPAERIEVVIHPQSIIHSMVEMQDGSVLAQMGFPDMKLPIQLALTWPERLPSPQPAFDPFDPRASRLTFEPPERKTFRLLDLAYMACNRGGSMPVVLNAANEAAVGLFLDGAISFPAIADRVEQCLNKHEASGFVTGFGFDDMIELDRRARDFVKEL
jgi:1-deoxy-D-xylulose-5-phosphate reductoisomerase